MCWKIDCVSAMDVVVVEVVRVANCGSASLLVEDCRVLGGARVAGRPLCGLSASIALAAATAVDAVTAPLLAADGRVMNSAASTVRILIESAGAGASVAFGS